MSRETIVPVLVIALVAGAGWYYREPLKQQFDKSMSSMSSPAAGDQAAGSAGPVPPRKETVYRWVDENGVTHYDQKAVTGSEAVEVDQGRIQSYGGYQGSEQALAADGSLKTQDDEHGASGKSMRAVDRFPQTQIVSPP